MLAGEEMVSRVKITRRLTAPKRYEERQDEAVQAEQPWKANGVYKGRDAPQSAR